jgi:chromosome partitioning protein
MKTVALFSIKGGVGKTTSAVSLAAAAARAGRRTLLVDLDAQGAATYILRVDPEERGKGKRFWSGDLDLRTLVRGSDLPGLDLVPAQEHLYRADLALDEVGKARSRLRRLLEPLTAEYDVVVLDCPPGWDLLAETAMRASDLLLVPTVPTPLSKRMLATLDGFLADWSGKAPAIAPFLTLVNGRSKDHLAAVTDLRASDARFMQAQVPACSDLERLGDQRQPVQCYAPRGAGALAYGQLWLEASARLGIDHA